MLAVSSVLAISLYSWIRVNLALPLLCAYGRKEQIYKYVIRCLCFLPQPNIFLGFYLYLSHSVSNIFYLSTSLFLNFKNPFHFQLTVCFYNKIYKFPYTLNTLFNARVVARVYTLFKKLNAYCYLTYTTYQKLNFSTHNSNCQQTVTKKLRMCICIRLPYNGIS